MTTKEAINTIEISISKVEWDYPMEYAVAFEKAIDALKRLEQIENIVNTPTYMQEDVLRYKMICGVLTRGKGK